MRRIGKRPWLPHPFQDWLNGAVFARLDAADRGGLRDLIDHAWMSDGCILPVEDDDLMARWSGLQDWKARKDRILPALDWYLEYLREEKTIYADICEKRQEAGRSGGIAMVSTIPRRTGYRSRSRSAWTPGPPGRPPSSR